MELEPYQLEADAGKLIEAMEPCAKSNAVRAKVSEFLCEVLQKRLRKSLVVECGSTCSRTYLPDSDLDLIVFTKDAGASNDSMSVLIDIFTALCEEIRQREQSSASFSPSLFTIRNVEFINARTKLVNCLVNNIGVDITVNQCGALSSLVFLEEADKLVGQHHLLKKSILLVKSWCLHESKRYTGGYSVLGARQGMFSSYAVSVMVLHLFNRYPLQLLQHPLQVLFRFLSYYSFFPWHCMLLGIGGVQALLPASSPSPSLFLEEKEGRERGEEYGQCPKNIFEGIIGKIRQQSLQLNEKISEYKAHSGNMSSSLPLPSSPKFILRTVNIVDPADESNNLGTSVAPQHLPLISTALRGGLATLSDLLQWGGGGGRGGGKSKRRPSKTEVAPPLSAFPAPPPSYPPPMPPYLVTEDNPPHHRMQCFPAPPPLPPLPLTSIPPTNSSLPPYLPPNFSPFLSPLPLPTSTLPPYTTQTLPPPSHSAGPSPLPILSPFFSSLFPLSSSSYLLPPGCQREELLEHPLQRQRGAGGESACYLSLLHSLSSLPSDPFLSPLAPLYEARDFIGDRDEALSFSSPPPPFPPAPSFSSPSLEEKEKENAQPGNNKDASPSSDPPPRSSLPVKEKGAKKKKEKPLPSIEKREVGTLTDPTPSSLSSPDSPSPLSPSFPAISPPFISRYNLPLPLPSLLVALVVPLLLLLLYISTSLSPSTLVSSYLSVSSSSSSSSSSPVTSPNLSSSHLSAPASHTSAPLTPSPRPSLSLPSPLTLWLLAGESVTFGEAEGRKGDFVWQRGGRDLLYTSLPLFSLAAASPQDAGHYVLRKRNSSRIVLETFLRISKKPRVLTRPFYQEVKKGKAFFLPLSIEALPFPSFQWFRNGYPLAGQVHDTLILEKVEEEDAGTYSCEVKNIAGAVLWLEATLVVVP